MSSPAGKAGKIAALLEPLRAAPDSSAIFCDIDGTIAPIADRPADARVLPATSDLLGKLAARYALVGCLSGRRAVEARALAGRDDLVYIGNHGFEQLLPSEQEASPAHALRGHGDAVGAFFEQHVDLAELERAGLRVEDKGPIRALHWRGAADEVAAEARARDLASEAIGRNLVPHWGRKVLEIRPAVELSKGTALAELLERHRIANALYGGDDRTDVDAFRTLRDMTAVGNLRAAVCIGIASAEGPAEVSREADAVVEGPEGFVATLRLLE